MQLFCFCYSRFNDLKRRENLRWPATKIRHVSSLPKVLKEFRKKEGLTQEQLLELGDIDTVQDKSQVSNYENGKFSPPYDFIVNVARALNYPEAYCYTLDDDFAELMLDIHRNKNNPETNVYIKPLLEVRKMVNELKEMLDKAAGEKK